MSWAHEGGAWAAPLGAEAQAIEVSNDGLEAPNVNGFMEREATARQTFIIGSDGKHGWGNYQNF
jgi:hypothetical protein